MSVMDVVEVISKSNFFSILMDGSTVHGKEIKSVDIQSFMKEQNSPANHVVYKTHLMSEMFYPMQKHLACLDRSIDLIKEH